MKIVTIMLVGLLLTAAAQTKAWDGERKGFVISCGFGPAMAQNLYEDRDFSITYQTNFKIGYAFSSQWQIHYAGYSAWAAGDLYNPLHNLTLGLTYYETQSAPGIMVSAGLGITFQKEDRAYYWGDQDEGFPTLVGGVGYEFRRHFNVEGTILSTWPAGKNTPRWHFHIGVNALVY